MAKIRITPGGKAETGSLKDRKELLRLLVLQN